MFQINFRSGSSKIISTDSSVKFLLVTNCLNDFSYSIRKGDLLSLNFAG